MTDFSFDKRVAQLYNQQRAHPPEVSAQIGQAIAALVGTSAPVLEIGVGTGRIAYPVAAGGCQVVGFDLSGEMLGEVADNQREDISGSISLLQSDMHHMPFEDDVFGGVMAVHVLHLAKDLPRVLHEIGRVLRKDGAFIQGNDWMDPESVIGKLRNQLRVLAMQHMPHLKPPSAGDPIGETLAAIGGTQVSEQVVSEWHIDISPNERLKMVENKLDAEAWIIPEDQFDFILGELRAFAAATWDDLDAPQPNTRRFTLKITQGAW